MYVFLKRALFLLVALAALVGAQGCNLRDRLEDRSDEEPPPPRKVQPVTGRGLPETPSRPSPFGLAPGSGARAEEHTINYFQDASSVPGKLKEKIRGPVRLLELALYPTYAFAEIQDPAKKENLD